MPTEARMSATAFVMPDWIRHPFFGVDSTINNQGDSSKWWIHV
jgi:hypothetical protein